MPTTSFRIGDTFPADDPVARFMTVVAMISNDWQRLATQMLDLDDAERKAHTDEQAALLITNYRLQASLHYEAARCLKSGHDNFPEIRRFIDALPAEATQQYEIVVGGIDPKSPHYHGKWLSDARNRTFHYSKLNRGEPAGKALRSAADREGSISAGATFGTVRFGFADVVALEWLGGPDPGVDGTRMAALSESVMAMTKFAQIAMRVYLAAKGIQLQAD
jgi:hypothetical protein